MKFRFRESLIKSTGRAKQVSRLRARNDRFRRRQNLLGAVLFLLVICLSGLSAMGQDQDADKKPQAVATSPKSKKASSKKEDSKSAPAPEKKKEEEKKPGMNADTFSGLKFRSLGPAVASGRVMSIAVNPKNKVEYYVGVASGGVWKTSNDGTTWTPVFEKEGSYSIGYVALDPNDPAVVWVGTGESNSQRSVSYGDGIYRSDDGGRRGRCGARVGIGDYIRLSTAEKTGRRC